MLLSSIAKRANEGSPAMRAKSGCDQPYSTQYVPGGASDTETAKQELWHVLHHQILGLIQLLQLQSANYPADTILQTLTTA